MPYSTPTVTDFKNYFFRDFPYGSTLDTVTDQDISNALQMCDINFNPNFWASQATFTIGYLLLTAHFMVMSLRASSQGISGQYSWLENSKSVGSVSDSFQIPQRILDNPELAMLSKTNYGARYLFLILPQLTGQVFSVCGTTQP